MMISRSKRGFLDIEIEARHIDFDGQCSPSTVHECAVARTRRHAVVDPLISQWHSTLPNPLPGYRVAFVIVEYPSFIPLGAATWGRPVARLEDQKCTLELTRLVHGPSAPPNMGTWALARMRRWISINMPEITRLISYQDADVHDGALYKADNWVKVYEKQTHHTWTNRPGRIGTERKNRIKWERKP